MKPSRLIIPLLPGFLGAWSQFGSLAEEDAYDASCCCVWYANQILIPTSG